MIAASALQPRGEYEPVTHSARYTLKHSHRTAW